MRGVISAGMVSALETLGMAPLFDGVYGSSAGAINAAYSWPASGAWHPDLLRGHQQQTLHRPGRAVRGRAIVDLGFLIDDVAVHRKRLDVGRVLASPPTLSVMATDLETESAVKLGGFEIADQLFGALRAGATMPVIAGGPHLYEGRRYLDASLTEPIAVPTAEHDEHTHVVALLTRDGGMRPRPSAFDRYFVGPKLRRLSPGLADRYLSRAEPYTALVQLIGAGTGPLGRAKVLGVSVPGLRISKLDAGPTCSGGARDSDMTRSWPRSVRSLDDQRERLSCTRRGPRGSRVRPLYHLHLLIPSDRRQSVRGRLSATFNLSDADTPLVFDFTPPIDHLETMAANGERATPRSARVRGRSRLTERLRRGANNHLQLPRRSGRSPPAGRVSVFAVRTRTCVRCPALLRQPDLKARWQLTLVIPHGWTALSNGRETACSGVPEGLLVTFEETAPLPTYLFAVVAGRFSVETAERHGRPVPDAAS